MAGIGYTVDEIVDCDFTLWLYERYMERKGKPLARPVKVPRPASPERADYDAAFDEWLAWAWPDQPEAATIPVTK